MQSTFVYSNCAPQVGKGFNQAMWKYLEDQVREWAKEKGDVWIFTGVYFEPDDSNGVGDSNVTTIGNGVGVPPHWYKVVYAPNGPSPADDELIAFKFENKAYTGKDFKAHEVTVRQIEDETGLDFLNKLSKAVQDKLETKKEVGSWN
jgi:endonuclease G, mitochondrial